MSVSPPTTWTWSSGGIHLQEHLAACCTRPSTALIGPPSVSLVSNGDNMEVSITDPEFSISSLKKAYTHPTYNITYWRDGQKEKAKSITRILQNRVVLDELDLWTNYCVKVQIHTERNLNPSRASMTVCESTTKREEAPWVAAVVTFVVMVVAAAVVGVAVVHHRRISHFLCPKVSLPHYFEDLQAPPNSMYRAMQDSQTTEEICHPFSVIADNGAVEEERPLQADRALEEERPLQADRAVEEERPLQADRAVEEERPLQADRSVEEERPLQADRAVEEERPQQADRAVEEERPQQADRAMEEARPLQAVRSSCSTEPDVTEGEGQGQIEEGNVTQVQPNQSQITL
uniref:interleukin-10 receptor subunit beta-like isoform X2 n=1 Tax=Semicossyphus pulcher TaxID=241346 RepID=UPI0037E92B68